MSNVYDDFDELADFALTSSEPPPPGTVSLEVELLSLISETNSSDITLNKEEVAAWIKSEDALLTGQQLVNPILHPYPSPPSSGNDKYSISDSDSEISEPSPPSKKSKHRSTEGDHEEHVIASVVQVKSHRRRRKRRENSDDSRVDRTSQRSRVTSSDHKHHDHKHHDHKHHNKTHSRSQSRNNTRISSQREDDVWRRRDKLIEQRPHHWPRYGPRRNDFNFRDARGYLSSRAEDRVHFEENIKKLEQQIKDSEEGARRLVREAKHAKEDLEIFVKNNMRPRDNQRSRDNTRDNQRSRDNGRSRDNRRSRDNARNSQDRQSSQTRSRNVSGKEEPCRNVSSKEEPCRIEVRSKEEEWIIRPPNKWDEHQIEGAGIIVSGFSRDTTRKDLFSYFSDFGTVTDVQLSTDERSKVACIIFKRQSEADRVLGKTSSQQQDHQDIRDHKKRSRDDREEDPPTTPGKESSEIDILTPPKASSFDILLNALRKDLTPQKLP